MINIKKIHSNFKRFSFSPIYYKSFSNLSSMSGNLDADYHFDRKNGYKQAIKYLKNINKKIRLEGIEAPQEKALQNVFTIAKSLNLIRKDKPILHIGGTNGKGSVCYKSAQSLALLGKKVGLFVSPHLVCYRERLMTFTGEPESNGGEIAIKKEIVSEESFVDLLDDITGGIVQYNQNNQEKIYLSEFELSFLMTLSYFYQINCDALVIEVGCGGIHDATNILEGDISIITSIGLDHTKILGNTIEEIAEKKVGIFKDNQISLIGPSVPLNIAKNYSKSLKNHNLITVQDIKDKIKDENNKIKEIINRYIDESSHNIEKLNELITLYSLLLLEKKRETFNISTVLSNNYNSLIRTLQENPPCRWEHFYVSKDTSSQDTGDSKKVLFILDMAHNFSALENLLNKFQREYPNNKLRVVFAVSRGKDVEACIKLVGSRVGNEYIHFVQSNYFRAISTNELEEVYYSLHNCPLKYPSNSDVQSTLQLAYNLASESLDTDKPEIVLVCGTGYIMGPTRAFCGIVESRDDLI